MGILTDWPPQPDELYTRSPAESRPIVQGDVFADVPFDKVRSGGSPTAKPNILTERRFVCVVNYPCDIYNESGELAKVQSVAVVRDVTKDRVPSEWNGSYVLCPYPNLMSDGALWAADFRAISNVDRQYLVPSNRIASLTEYGWAFFRHRYVLAVSRVLVKPEVMQELGKDMWKEIELWDEWALSQASATFQSWFTSSNGAVGGFSPKDLVLKGDFEEVQELMRSQLQLL